MWRLQELFLAADSEVDALKRHALAWEAVQIHIDEGPFMLGTVANYPRIVIASKELVNVPRKEELFLGGWINPWNVCYPAITNPETYCFS